MPECYLVSKKSTGNDSIFADTSRFAKNYRIAFCHNVPVNISFKKSSSAHEGPFRSDLI